MKVDYSNYDGTNHPLIDGTERNDHPIIIDRSQNPIESSPSLNTFSLGNFTNILKQYMEHADKIIQHAKERLLKQNTTESDNLSLLHTPNRQHTHLFAEELRVNQHNVHQFRYDPQYGLDNSYVIKAQENTRILFGQERIDGVAHYMQEEHMRGNEGKYLLTNTKGMRFTLEQHGHDLHILPPRGEEKVIVKNCLENSCCGYINDGTEMFGISIKDHYQSFRHYETLTAQGAPIPEEIKQGVLRLAEELSTESQISPTSPANNLHNTHEAVQLHEELTEHTVQPIRKEAPEKKVMRRGMSLG